ncbi:MAG: hypothetical protein ACHQF0_17800 [Chitinophagales bacterium]
MKKKLLIFIFFAIGFNTYCQPAIRIFAFEQGSLPGTIPAGVKDENGNPIKKAAATTNYLVFLSFKKTNNINPVQLFIKGRVFSIRAIIDRKTPVEYTDSTIPNKPEKTILIPQTKNKVIEVRATEMAEEPEKTSYVQKLTKTNDVVMFYTWNKKKYFITQKRIKKLEPLVNE